MKKKLIIGLIVAVLGIGVGYSMYSSNNSKVEETTNSYLLKDAETEYEAIKKENKDYVVLYAAAWCPHCRETIDKLIENDPNNEKNITIIFLPFVSGENGLVSYENQTLKYIEEKKLKYNILFDSDKKILSKYHIKSVPSITVIKDGNVVTELQPLEDDIMKYIK